MRDSDCVPRAGVHPNSKTLTTDQVVALISIILDRWSESSDFEDSWTRNTTISIVASREGIHRPIDLKEENNPDLFTETLPLVDDSGIQSIDITLCSDIRFAVLQISCVSDLEMTTDFFF